MRIIRKVFCVVALVFLAAGACFACHCREPIAAAVSFQQADAVFLGQVVGRTDGDASAFRVMKSWKGLQESRAFVSASGFDSDYRFELGEVYIVYAQRSGGLLSASVCGGSAPLLSATDQLRDLQDKPTTSLLPTFHHGYGRMPYVQAYVLAAAPRHKFWNLTLVTGVSVLLSISVGFLVTRASRRLAVFRSNKL